MKRKLLSIILILCMTLSTMYTTAVATDANTPQYSDTAGHWAQDAIQRWSDLSIINTVGNKSLSDASTYRELGNLTHSSGGANWNFDSVWTFAVSASYSFPILQEIPAHLQKAK